MAWSADLRDVCVSFETAKQQVVLEGLTTLGFEQHPGWDAPKENTHKPGHSTTWGTLPEANMNEANKLEGVIRVWWDPT